MRVETGLGDRPWDEVARQARLAEEMGFDGIGAPELKRDPFLTVAVAARETKTIRLETSVAIAFPRSPMVVAYESFNLQEMSGGRFVLGLGTQVKGHIERRFSTTWDSPGPRLRDYVQSLRAIWDPCQSRSARDRADEATSTPTTYCCKHVAVCKPLLSRSPHESAYRIPLIMVYHQRSQLPGDRERQPV